MKKIKIKTYCFLILSLLFLCTFSTEARRVKDIEAKTSLHQTLLAIGYEEKVEEIIALIKEVFPDLEELKTLPVEERIEQLALMIKEKIKTYEQGTFELTAVLREEKANCFGYSQLFYVLGKEIGLEAEIILIYPNHAINLIRIGSQFVIVDLTDDFLDIRGITVFWRENYVQDGNLWRFREGRGLSGKYNLAARLNEQEIVAGRHYNRGVARHDLGYFAEAVIYYTKALELKPDFSFAFCNRGVARVQLKQLEEAILDFTKAIELNPTLAEAFYNRGIVRHDLGQFMEAISDYTKALELKPDYALAFLNRGISWYKLGRYLEAMNDFDKAIELKPDYALAFLNRGNLRVKLGQLEEAISDYTEALVLNPFLASAFSARGLVRYRLGQFEEAIQDLKTAVLLNPDLYDLLPQEIKELLRK
ncbi:MAG: tetratricopeptide repeat protein [Candidatus Omnitrophica bacterium]|nr:tetratricopeptide repeat protein [Candidatus Omnitrophota bacterium]